MNLKNDPKSENRSAVTILNKNGKEIFRKDYPITNRVSVSGDGNRILIPHERIKTPDDPYYVSYYDAVLLDSLGNTIINIFNVSTPYFKISNNGRYAITTRVVGPDAKGSFQIFDLKTGNEIPISIKYKSEIFLADHLSNDKIVIIIQPPVTFDRATNTNKIINEEKSPAIMLIYSIVNQMIIIEKELFSSDNENIWIDNNNGVLSTSEGGNLFAIAGNNISLKRQYSNLPKNITIFNSNGNTLFEKTIDVKDIKMSGVLNMKFLNDDILLVEKFGMSESKIYMFNPANMSLIWEYNLGEKATINMGESFIINDRLLINSRKGTYEFEQKTGKLILNDSKLKHVRINKESRKIILDNGNIDIIHY